MLDPRSVHLGFVVDAMALQEVGPSHHCMARPQVADGGTTYRYGGLLRIY